MEVITNISYGYKSLLDTFFEANELNVISVSREYSGINPKITLIYEDESDTAMKITYMSFIHCGFENMLCDYLIRCGIPVSRISEGSFMNRNMQDLDEQFEEYWKIVKSK